MIGGRIISDSLGALAGILFVRYIGPAKFGEYSFVFTYLGFFNVFTDLGIGLILVREIAGGSARTDKLVGNAIIIKIFCSIVAFALSCLVINFLNCSLNLRILVFIASVTFLFSFRLVYGLIFEANLDMKYPVFIRILTNLLRYFVFILLIYLRAPLIWFVIAISIEVLPAVFLFPYFSRKIVLPDFHIDFGIWKYFLKE